jgi:hypothetical protein
MQSVVVWNMQSLVGARPAGLDRLQRLAGHGIPSHRPTIRQHTEMKGLNSLVARCDKKPGCFVIWKAASVVWLAS